MSRDVLAFTVAGSPRAVSREIEKCATACRGLSALVVPWESEAAWLSMAVTAVKSDGWAVEHTNLGTVRLTEVGHDRTRVALSVEDFAQPGGESLAAVFQTFAEQIQRRFERA